MKQKKYKFECGCEFPIVAPAAKHDILPFIDFDVTKVTLHCPATWKMIIEGNTKGFFQIESNLLRHWCKEIKPEDMNELSDVISLVRPGCLKAVSDGKNMPTHYADRKFGREEIKYLTELLRPILEDTRGVLIYQETAMRICQELAGFNLQEADTLRKAAGKKLAEEMAKVKKMFLEKAKECNLVSDEHAAEIFDWIEKSQRYSFNKCFSKDVVILRNRGKYKTDFTIEEMFKIRNDLEYAKKTGHEVLRRKWKRLGNYGKGWSLGDDGRIRPNVIENISFAGRNQIYRLMLEDGNYVDATLNHKFPTNQGEKTLFEISEDIDNFQIYSREDYEVNDSTKYSFSSWTNEDRAMATGKSGFDTHGPQNRWYTNGSFTKFKQNKSQLDRNCGDCGKEDCRLECHHIDGDRHNSELDNLVNLCASCHKKREYKMGRKKRGEKGYPSKLVNIESVTYLRTDDTYDVTMGAPYHNLVVNDRVVASNSHGVSYSYLAYYSAYCKAHFPLQFFTKWLDMAKEKPEPHLEIQQLVNNARLMGIDVMPPDIRLMKRCFSNDGYRVYFGLGNIKGIGESMLEKLFNILESELIPILGPIDKWEWYSFLTKCSSKISKTVINALILSGALTQFKMARGRMLFEYEQWSELTSKEQEWIINKGDAFNNILDAFRGVQPAKKDGGGCANVKRSAKIADLILIIENPPYSLEDKPDRVSFDEETLLGISLTCSQVDACDTREANTTCKEYVDGKKQDYMLLAVEIETLREYKTKTGQNPGQKMAFLTVRDNTCSLDNCVVFPDAFAEFGSHLIKGNTVLIQAERDTKKDSLIVKKAWSI